MIFCLISPFANAKSQLITVLFLIKEIKIKKIIPQLWNINPEK
jgi:hypothetical protein